MQTLAAAREWQSVRRIFTKSSCEFLHVSPRVVLRWIMLGWLKVRDSRISIPSFEAFSMTHAPQLTLGEPRFLALGGSNSRAGYTWAKVAKHFRAGPETVQDWISRGWLKFCDAHITERSFEDFCRKHGSEINYDLQGAVQATALRTRIARFLPGCRHA